MNKKPQPLTKHISCKCKCEFDGKKCNSDQWWNNDKCQCECKKRYVLEKYYIWNPSTCSCENGKYLASIMDYSGILCDEATESYDKETKTIPTSINEEKQPIKLKIYILYLHFS